MKSPQSVCSLLLAASLGAWSLLAPSPAAAAKIKILIMPKLVGIPYYNAVKKGVDEASNEFKSDTTVIWQGPTTDQVDKQIEMLDNAVAARPSVIAVAADDPAAIVPVLKKAKAAGSHVMTWDGDADYRECFVNFVSYDAFGAALVEEMVKQVGENADTAVVTSTLTAPNQSAWLAAGRLNSFTRVTGANPARCCSTCAVSRGHRGFAT